VYIYLPKNIPEGVRRLYTTWRLHNKNLPKGAYTDDIHPDTHPVGYTIFTNDIIPSKKEKSSLDNTTKLKTTNYIYS